MFDKQIKVKIKGVTLTFTNEEVQKLAHEHSVYRDAMSEMDTQGRDARFEIELLKERLGLANAKLKDYGHNSGF